MTSRAGGRWGQVSIAEGPWTSSAPMSARPSSTQLEGQDGIQGQTGTNLLPRPGLRRHQADSCNAAYEVTEPIRTFSRMEHGKPRQRCQGLEAVRRKEGQTDVHNADRRPWSGATPSCAASAPSSPERALSQHHSDDPDVDLLARVASGDETAFRLLIRRKLARIHGLAARLLDDRAMADDVAQEAFLRVWRNAGNWRVGEARFDTWLHRVVVNLCTDRLRKRRLSFMAEPPDQVDEAPLADGQIAREETALRVRAALARLPQRQREAIILQTYQELSNTATASAMGISVEALESLLSRARRSLRSMLGEDEP